MSEIPLKASVQCTDGPCGTSTNVIVNPVTHQVTHVALKDDKLPDNPTRLVPIATIANATHTQITLDCSRDDVARMEPFVVTQFIQGSGSDGAYASGGAYSSQYVINDTGYDSVQEEEIPQGELAVYSGMTVQASDGKVGKLDALVLDPKSGEITHLQMREGHLWGKKDVAIPIADVDATGGNTVLLKIDKEAVKALPAVPVKRRAD
jgi:sporulation protein YlmC with PRC-barrel domain